MYEVKKIVTTVQRKGTGEEGRSHESQNSKRQPLDIVSGNPENVYNALGFQQDVRCEISAVLLNTERRVMPQSWKNTIYKNVSLIGKKISTKFIEI